MTVHRTIRPRVSIILTPYNEVDPRVFLNEDNHVVRK